MGLFKQKRKKNVSKETESVAAGMRGEIQELW